MKKLLSVALVSTLGFSASLTLMPYGSYINYTDSTKDNAKLAGIYGSYFKSKVKLEVDGEYLKINYKNSIPAYYQKDLTIVGHYYIGSNYDIHGGIHNIFIDQTNNPNNYQKVLFGGILYYKYLKYNFGADYYYSDYRGFDVKQITPKIGFNFGNYYSKIGSFYAEAKVNYIDISDKNKAGSKDDRYVNSDIKLSNYNGAWTTTLKTSLGKNSYKVGGDGFVVYNLGEEYKYSYGIDESYALSKNSSIKAQYSRSKFNETNKDGYSNTFLISYSHSF